MTAAIEGVRVANLGAGEFSVCSASTRIAVHTSSHHVAVALGRALAIVEGLVRGVVGSPAECPRCMSVRTFVAESRPCRDTIWRRRRCRACRARWTTEERTVDRGDA